MSEEDNVAVRDDEEEEECDSDHEKEGTDHQNQVALFLNMFLRQVVLDKFAAHHSDSGEGSDWSDDDGKKGKKAREKKRAQELNRLYGAPKRCGDVCVALKKGYDLIPQSDKKRGKRRVFITIQTSWPDNSEKFVTPEVVMDEVGTWDFSGITFDIPVFRRGEQGAAKNTFTQYPELAFVLKEKGGGLLKRDTTLAIGELLLHRVVDDESRKGSRKTKTGEITLSNMPKKKQAISENEKKSTKAVEDATHDETWGDGLYKISLVSKKKGEIGTFEALMSYSQTVDDDEGDDERQVIPEDFED